METALSSARSSQAHEAILERFPKFGMTGKANYRKNSDRSDFRMIMKMECVGVLPPDARSAHVDVTGAHVAPPAAGSIRKPSSRIANDIE
jgi:hypothetical protein